MLVRRYSGSDLGGVIDLVRPVLAGYGFSLDADALEADFSRSAGWVAEDAGAVVGCLVLKDSGGAGELSRFYVRADARGAGIGRELYGLLEEEAARREWRRIHLASSRRFVEAHRFYRARGFRLVESLDNDWEDDLFEKLLP